MEGYIHLKGQGGATRDGVDYQFPLDFVFYPSDDCGEDCTLAGFIISTFLIDFQIKIAQEQAWLSDRMGDS